MFFVYVLRSDGFNRTYTEMTSDIEKRLKQHNNKENKSTKAYTPWRLIYSEAFETRTKSREREKYLKSGVGREFIKKNY